MTSYGHYPIANFVKAVNGQTVVLIQRNTYSVTTAQQIADARDAVNGLGYEVYRVHNVTPRSKAEHRENVKKLVAIIVARAEEWSRKTKYDQTFSWYKERLYSEWEQVELYGKRFALGKVAGYNDVFNAVCKLRDKMDAYEKRIVNREIPGTKENKAWLKNVEKRKAQLQSKIDKWSSGEGEDFGWAEARRVREAIGFAEFDRLKSIRGNNLIVQQQARLERWKAGEDVSLGYWSHETQLRVKGNRVQTSRGAEVPLIAGKKLFEIYKSVMAASISSEVGFEKRKPWGLASIVEEGEERWYPREPLAVGSFTLGYIDHKSGDAVIGCHLLKAAVINEFIKKEGWDE